MKFIHFLYWLAHAERGANIKLGELFLFFPQPHSNENRKKETMAWCHYDYQSDWNVQYWEKSPGGSTMTIDNKKHISVYHHQYSFIRFVWLKHSTSEDKEKDGTFSRKTCANKCTDKHCFHSQKPFACAHSPIRIFNLNSHWFSSGCGWRNRGEKLFVCPPKNFDLPFSQFRTVYTGDMRPSQIFNYDLKIEIKLKITHVPSSQSGICWNAMH